MTRFVKLAVTTLLVGYLLVVLGGAVRVAGAESGCGPGWVGCDGSLTPILSFPIAFDYFHRAFAAVETLLAVGLVVLAWRESRSRGLLLSLSGAALGLVLIQGVLGMVTAQPSAGAAVGTAHLALAELFLAVVALVALVASAGWLVPADWRSAGRRTSAGWLAIAAAVGVFALLSTGAYTALSGSGTACAGWPLCGDRVVPTGWTPVDIHLIHRWVASIATTLILALAIQVRRVRSDSPALVGLATGGAVLMVAQVFVGAANVWMDLNPVITTAHLAVATIVWGGVVSVAALDRMLPVSERVPAAQPARRVWRDYFVLTKPGVMALLLTTTLGAMLFAKAGLPPARILFWTLIGGALASGGAAAINHYLDRDIDRIMTRTRNRPVAGGRVTPVQALIFGVTLSVLSVYLMAVFVNTLAALLSLAGNLYYVVIYTMWLKRATPQNIVIGGVAGSIPPLVGWAAVTGNVGLPAIIMFIIVFAWTPPHFWALALFRSKTRDYAAAGVPMYPAVYGDAKTRQQIFIYTLLLVITSLLLVFPLQANGLLYFGIAAVLGGVFVHKAVLLLRRPAQQPLLARSLFMYSNYYLALLFLAMVVDRLVLA